MEWVGHPAELPPPRVLTDSGLCLSLPREFTPERNARGCAPPEPTWEGMAPDHRSGHQESAAVRNSHLGTNPKRKTLTAQTAKAPRCYTETVSRRVWTHLTAILLQVKAYAALRFSLRSAPSL